MAAVTPLELLAQLGNEAILGRRGGRDSGGGGSDGCGRRRRRGVGSTPTGWCCCYWRSAVRSRRLTLLFRSHYSHVEAHLPSVVVLALGVRACGRAGVRAGVRGGGKMAPSSIRGLNGIVIRNGLCNWIRRGSRAPIRVLLAVDTMPCLLLFWFFGFSRGFLVCLFVLSCFFCFFCTCVV